MEGNSKYFGVKLTKQQEIAFNSLKNFINISRNKVFLLKGYAGTGKTTLIGGLKKWMDEVKVSYKLLASTGRAAKILSNFTDSEVKTIHSQIYTFSDLSEDIEKVSLLRDNLEVDDTGQIRLVFELKMVESSIKKVYIIDEASMVGDVHYKSTSFAKYGTGMLLNDLLSYDKNGKFIFVGDPCQLPPIGQIISPALSAEYFHTNYHLKAEEFELKEIIRQSVNNGIVESSLKLRNLQIQNPPVKWASLPVRGYNNISLQSSHANLIEAYLERLLENGYYDISIICQTNRHCSDLNRIIRRALGRRDDTVEKGDLLMVTQNNYVSKLVNGDQCIIKQTGKSEYRCGLTFLKVQVEELATKCSYNLLMVEDILYSTSTNLNDKQHKDLMIDYYFRMKEQGISQKDRRFRDNMMIDPYLNALKAVYGYALTCHKSQGGEWNEIFLYLDNKIHGIPKPSIYQWWYTAVTRAKKELHVVDDWFIR